jgi:hypothetical protein
VKNTLVDMGDITALRDNLENDLVRIAAQSPKIVHLGAALVKEKFMTVDSALTLYELQDYYKICD